MPSMLRKNFQWLMRAWARAAWGSDLAMQALDSRPISTFFWTYSTTKVRVPSAAPRWRFPLWRTWILFPAKVLSTLSRCCRYVASPVWLRKTKSLSSSTEKLVLALNLVYTILVRYALRNNEVGYDALVYCAILNARLPIRSRINC